MGCLFHYGQAVWRKVQALGDAGEHGDNAERHGSTSGIVQLGRFVPLRRLEDACGQTTVNKKAPIHCIIPTNDTVLRPL